jgi:pantoate--beta-alanine ligase
MRVIKNIASLRLAVKNAKAQKRNIGFIPTMGALHEGHCSLIRKCRRENDLTVVSIFVNPKQFGPKEDFAAYPRPEKKDNLLAKKEKVDIIFHPSEKEMYPTGFLTCIQVDKLADTLCGASRPGHFRGVVTVVAKLLNIVAPDVLYLGQKDAQQVVVIKQMIADLNFPVAVQICPIVREGDGLAVSSRNSYLTPRQRQEAPVLFASLKRAKITVLEGAYDAKRIIRLLRIDIEEHSSGTVDYIACVDADTLVPLSRVKGKVMIALAVRFGQTRLIDNVIFYAS